MIRLFVWAEQRHQCDDIRVLGGLLDTCVEGGDLRAHANWRFLLE